MSELAVAFPGNIISGDEATRKIKRDIQSAREDRRRFEPTWHSNLAFAAGKHWLTWDRDQRKLTFPPELYGKDLYSADVITEYRTTAISELSSGDDRPQLLLRREDEPSEGFEKILNTAVEYGWDEEWHGDDVLEEIRRLVVDLGTAGVRCRFDPDYGPVVQDNVPHLDGKPVLDMEQATQLMSEDRSGVKMKPIKRGRIRWEVLSPFNIIIPPGVPNERDFPWECVVRPISLAEAKSLWGDLVADLKEDTDIGSILGLDMKSEMSDTYSALGSPEGSKSSRLKGYVWVFTYYERPTNKFPCGRTVVFVGNKMVPVSIEEMLPYETADGSYHSGLVYFHWWRVSGRFWSRSLVENMKDVQRSVNKRATQKNEIIDRGLPYVIVETNSRTKERRGLPMELLEIDRDERPPQPVQGLSPGDWMYRDIEMLRADLEHATGLRGPRLGENPTGVTTYAQLALLNENDQLKRQTIRREHVNAIARLVELSVHDIRTYWGPERMVPLAGEEQAMELRSFDATKIPSFFMVKVAKGGTKPRSQAAELQKVQDLWVAAANSGAVQQDPHAWVHWYKQSLEAGEALDLPDPNPDVHFSKARLENHLMLQGQQIPAQYYDPIQLHIPVHREAQIQAEMSGDMQTWHLIEDHVHQHMAIEAANQMHMAQINQQAPPGPPGPPQPEGPPNAQEGLQGPPQVG